MGRDRDRRRSDSSPPARRRPRRSRSPRRRRRSRSRSSTVSKTSSRYYSRKKSVSRERSSRKHYSKSKSRSRSRNSSRSRSRDRSDYSKSKKQTSQSSRHKSTKHSRSSKRHSSSESTSSQRKGEHSKKFIVDDTESKVEKAIKAAEAVGLTMCKLPLYETKEIEIKEDMPTIQDRNVLDELNAESFAPKQFTSSRNKKMTDNIVIDLDAGTMKVPVEELPQVDSLFHPDLFPDEKTRMDKWVKKMYQFRQKALRGEI